MPTSPPAEDANADDAARLGSEGRVIARDDEAHGASDEGHAHRSSSEPVFTGDDHPTDVISSTREHETTHASRSHAATQAFWALAPEERDIVDDYGTPIFRIGPTAWALVIEDRGETFVVRHDDGRIGYLHDTAGVTRG